MAHTETVSLVLCIELPARDVRLKFAWLDRFNRWTTDRKSARVFTSRRDARDALEKYFPENATKGYAQEA